MGVVNATPDSFSAVADDPSRGFDPTAVIEHGRRLAEQGADILDIGGESTRPGAVAVPIAVELARVMPVLQALRDCGKAISIDTRHPEVMRAALSAGADIINDIGGFRLSEACQAVADHQRCGIVAMHMQGEPPTMQKSPAYQDVVSEVRQFLYLAVEGLTRMGVAPARIAVDPGFGFGKTVAHNIELMRGLPRLVDLGHPVLIGVSRKGMIGALTGGRPVDERLAGSLGAMLAGVARGARVVRVHDVAASRDALAVWNALGLDR